MKKCSAFWKQSNSHKAVIEFDSINKDFILTRGIGNIVTYDETKEKHVTKYNSQSDAESIGKIWVFEYEEI